MVGPFVIAVAQPPCVPLDIAANISIHARTVREARARVVVFPELSLTGYHMDAPTVSPGDRRFAPLVQACADSGSVALVGAALAGPTGKGTEKGLEQKGFIALLAVDGSGVSVAYRKQWLSTEESRHFVAGGAPAVYEVDGRRLGLAICKDTSIAQHAADTSALGIDGYVASTLLSREETAELPARACRVAAEHGAWVATASFAGSTGEGYEHAAGCSGIWSKDGAVIEQVGPEPGLIAVATFA
ncbi:putative amidohydrolase [Nakamurella sp. UYEF19]|uniref:carbon-nitrogen hydrolase family protein n=1 Tax=Nakamurella sp. UYEF19 TaxID=1756392 RepID=UPI0033910C1C